LLPGSCLRIHAGVLFRWVHPFLWIVSQKSLEVGTLWSLGKRIGSAIAYTATTYGIGRRLKTAYVSPLYRPDNLCPILAALSRSVQIFRYILQKSMVPVAPFDRNFEMARHREHRLEVAQARGSGHCNKPADIGLVMDISVQCTEATKEHCHSGHGQLCQSSGMLLRLAAWKGQAIDGFARPT